MTNFVDSLTVGLSSIVGTAGLEILQTVVICIGFVKVVQVIYKIAKDGYTNEKGTEIVWCSAVIGIGRVLPDLFAYIVSLLGV